MECFKTFKASLVTVLKLSVKVKSDHRSKFSNLSKAVFLKYKLIRCSRLPDKTS